MLTKDTLTDDVIDRLRGKYAEIDAPTWDDVLVMAASTPTASAVIGAAIILRAHLDLAIEREAARVLETMDTEAVVDAALAVAGLCTCATETEGDDD